MRCISAALRPRHVHSRPAADIARQAGRRPLRRRRCAVCGRSSSPGSNYAKAGVLLLDLQGREVDQAELDQTSPAPIEPGLMGAVHALNDRYGRSTVGLTSAGLAGGKRPFEMKRERRTPEYATRLSGLRPRGRHSAIGSGANGDFGRLLACELRTMPWPRRCRAWTSCSRAGISSARSSSCACAVTCAAS